MNVTKYQFLNYFNPAFMNGFCSFYEMQLYFTRLKWFSLWLFFGLFFCFNNYSPYNKESLNYFCYLIFLCVPGSGFIAYIANIYADKFISRFTLNRYVLPHCIEIWNNKKEELIEIINQLDCICDEDKKILNNNPNDDMVGYILKKNWCSLFYLELTERLNN